MVKSLKSAKAGAQWLWAGFALLWRAPLRLGAWPVVGHVFLIADAGGLQVAKRAVLRAVSDVSSHPTTDGECCGRYARLIRGVLRAPEIYCRGCTMDGYRSY